MEKIIVTKAVNKPKYNCKLYINKNLVLLSILFVAIVSKFVLLYVLPDKYLYDSNAIIKYSGGEYLVDQSYTFSSSFFAPIINLFSISDAANGSLIIGLICNILFLIYLKKYLPKALKIEYYVYLLIVTFLANIYVFNISKELITLIVLFCSFFITRMFSKKANILICVLFISCAFFFRTYFALIGLLYYLLNKIDCNVKTNQKASFFFLICLMATLIIYSLNNSLFYQIFNFGEDSNLYRDGSVDAQTMIMPILENTNYIFSIINYIFNVLSFLVPLKLIMKGSILYLAYFAFSIFTILLIIKNRKKIFDNQKIKYLFFLLLSFFLTSALFEPDYGSYLRHISTIMFFSYGSSIYWLSQDSIVRT